MSESDLQGHRELLADVARIYERLADRPAPFNVFSVLRSASDEVNLHSRVLQAVLDHTDPQSGKRDNLREFVSQVANGADFELERGTVHREAGGVDLLISNGREAIVVENKIWAGDQDQQLLRYRDALLAQGYDDDAIRLVYLTPYGHKPSAQSLGGIPVERVRCVSYRDDLPDWLVACQRRAFDEPALRESIAQYVDLIRKLTRTDYESETMTELKKLLLENDNVVLAHRVAQALVPAVTELVVAFYGYVDRSLRKEIGDLPDRDPDWSYLAEHEAVRYCVAGRGSDRDSGLYYRVEDGVWLYAGGSNRLTVAVYCLEGEHTQRHGELKQALAGMGGRHLAWNWAPWARYLDQLPSWDVPGEWLHIRNANEYTLGFLSSGENAQANLVLDLCNSTRAVLAAIRSSGTTAGNGS